jgi:hypothetical protein
MAATRQIVATKENTLQVALVSGVILTILQNKSPESRLEPIIISLIT